MNETAGQSRTSRARFRLSVVSGALQHLSIPELAAALRDMAVQSVELTMGESGHLRQDKASTIEDAARCFADAGVEVCGVAATAEWQLDDPGLRRVFAAADRLGAPFVRLFAPHFDRGRAWEAQFDDAARALSAIAADTSTKAEAFVEPAPGSVAPSPELARRLVETAGDSVGVVYDPGSLVVEGHLHPDLAVAVLGPRLRHVHVKNRALEHSHGSWLSVSRPLMQGSVDWLVVLGVLAQSGYSGSLSIDHLSGSPTIEQLRADMSDLRALFDEAGVAGSVTEAKQSSREL